jgi:hypothetical protein
MNAITKNLHEAIRTLKELVHHRRDEPRAFSALVSLFELRDELLMAGLYDASPRRLEDISTVTDLVEVIDIYFDGAGLTITDIDELRDAIRKTFPHLE